MTPNIHSSDNDNDEDIGGKSSSNTHIRNDLDLDNEIDTGVDIGIDTSLYTSIGNNEIHIDSLSIGEDDITDEEINEERDVEDSIDEESIKEKENDKSRSSIRNDDIIKGEESIDRDNNLDDKTAKTNITVNNTKQENINLFETLSPQQKDEQETFAHLNRYNHQQQSPIPAFPPPPTLNKDGTTSKEDDNDEDGWQQMETVASQDIYDDDGKLVARAMTPPLLEEGGIKKGYTRINMDEDAKSDTSFDDHTRYLFNRHIIDEDDSKTPVHQMETTRQLLTEAQKIAYAGVCRLVIFSLTADAAILLKKSSSQQSLEQMQLWGQTMMMRIYNHLNVSPEEQAMIEALAEHGVKTTDLAPALMGQLEINNPLLKDAVLENEFQEDETFLVSKEKSTKGSLSNLSRPDSPAAENEDQNEETSKLEQTKEDDISNDHEKGERREQTASKLETEDLPIYYDKDEEDITDLPQYELHASELPEEAENEKDDIVDAKEQLEESEKTNETEEEIKRKKTLSLDIRWTVLCDLFLLLIADSMYDARSRVLLVKVGEHLGVEWIDVTRFEKRITDSLEVQERAEQSWSEEVILEERKKLNVNRRYMLMGLATLGGSLVIGLSAGLLAPVIGAGLGAAFTTIGVTGTTGFLAGTGGAALITTGGIMTGGGIAVKGMANRTKAVKTFEFKPLHDNKRTNLLISVSGWMSGKEDDVRLPFSTIDPIMGDIYSILWEPEMLRSMGQTINILATEALTQTLQQVLGSTLLVALMSALQWPIVLTKLGYLIDNPWSNSLDRAKACGLILADTLINRHLGLRPVSLVGYSLGARVIYYCLLELHHRRAYGIVQDVFLFGSPVVVKIKEWCKVSTVVAGRLINGYLRNDWILGYLFRATSGGIGRVAGIRPVLDVPGVENIDVTGIVEGHMGYREAMPKLMKKVGWIVTSEKFSEIEDPDPDKLRERQRELLDNIDAAKSSLKKGGHKSDQRRKIGLNIFGRKKKPNEADKIDTEDDFPEPIRNDSDTAIDGEGNKDDVLFDIEKIRGELHTSPESGRDLNEHGEGTSEIETVAPTPSRTPSNFTHKHDPTDRYSISTTNSEDYKETFDSFKEYTDYTKGKVANGFHPVEEMLVRQKSQVSDLFKKSSEASTPPPSTHSYPIQYTTKLPPPSRNVWRDEDEDKRNGDEIIMTFD